MIDNLGDRMKRYEATTRSTLMPHAHTIIRVDGRSFHTYLRKAEKPYDFQFIDDMGYVAKVLCEEISGSILAYGQSDEISVLTQDLAPQSQPWFGGVVQKMASVAAGVATAALIERRGAAGRPHFDARVFTMPAGDVANYFIWRQNDAVRNSINSLAQAHFSARELHKVSTNKAQEMLWQEKGINWDNTPADAKRGTTVYKLNGSNNWHTYAGPVFVYGHGLLSEEFLAGKGLTDE